MLLPCSTFVQTPVTAEGKGSVKVTASAARLLVLTSTPHKHKPFSSNVLLIANEGVHKLLARQRGKTYSKRVQAEWSYMVGRPGFHIESQQSFSVVVTHLLLARSHCFLQSVLALHACVA